MTTRDVSPVCVGEGVPLCNLERCTPDYGGTSLATGLNWGTLWEIARDKVTAVPSGKHQDQLWTDRHL